jgi:hypothetical protein
MMDYSTFVNVMTDITGKIPLRSDDPRWIQFFNLRVLPDLVVQPQILMEYFERWSLNNPNTKNFIHLLEHLLSRLKYASKKNIALTNSFVLECCTGMYISTVFLQYIISNHDIKEVQQSFSFDLSHLFFLFLLFLSID